MNTATTATTIDDWMPEHCLPPKTTNHDDYSFTPLSLSSSSEHHDATAATTNSYADNDDDEGIASLSLSLPLPPSRLLHHHSHIVPPPSTTKVNYHAASSMNYRDNHLGNIIDRNTKGSDGGGGEGEGKRAKSPNSVTAFPPSSLISMSSQQRRSSRRCRPRTNNNDEEDISVTIVNKMETYLPSCGGGTATSSVDVDRGGRGGVMWNDLNRHAELYKEGATMHRGDSNDYRQQNRKQQQHEGEHLHRLQQSSSILKDEVGNESSSSSSSSLSHQLSSGMEFLTMLTCGLLNHQSGITSNNEEGGLTEENIDE